MNVGTDRKWSIAIPLTTVRADYVLSDGTSARRPTRALVISWYGRPEIVPRRWGAALVFVLINDRQRELDRRRGTSCPRCGVRPGAEHQGH